MWRFDLKKLHSAEVKEQYRISVSTGLQLCNSAKHKHHQSGSLNEPESEM
jgi:hypothetical protein